VQLREYEYTRHGTTCLIANLEIWCGWIIAPTLGPTRTEADFVAHIEQTVATDPDAGWVFIVDNSTVPDWSALMVVTTILFRTCVETRTQASLASPGGPISPQTTESTGLTPISAG
jgi:hypothetical protein